VRIINGRPEGAASEHRTSTFTGDVYADAVLAATDGVAVNAVLFTPGARTYWHSHADGQVLHVLLGSGWVCVAGGEPQRIGGSDTVWTPPDEVHWHGAGPDGFLSHLAISLGTTTWLDEVSPDEYETRG
jgi:quercetin dioxygenase-like cupin family protein